MAGRLAVLIDGENICGDLADELFERVSELGHPVVRRVYGNFAGTQANTWLAAMVRHGILARQICSAKNAADIALAIDAIDLLHGGRLDGFCIVSGDKGLALLATRLKEMNLDAYGFCRENALDEVRGSFTQTFKLGPKKDLETVELSTAVRAQMVEGWAALSALGKVIDHKKYGRSSLSKLLEANKHFVLDAKKKRVRLAS
jgi:NYN domain